ncbi:MAG: DUF2442 domain-containing protein [Spartobacteria bacterium]|nr:DUF2442 domain-containing protein [Spartobacteria bacterium]
MKYEIPKVVKATYLHDYVIHLQFADKTEGDIDLKDELYGEMFEPLKNLELFKGFSIHPEFCTLCWPNGADIAPEFLFENIMVTA